MGTDKVYATSVRLAYAKVNGIEASMDLSLAVTTATAHYANLNGYTIKDPEVMVALDVLRLVEGNEFELSIGTCYRKAQ